MEYVQGNIFVREMRFEKAGDFVDGHAHNFDHTTYIARGAARIESLADDGTVFRTADKRASDGLNFILIKAGVKHRITALPSKEISEAALRNVLAQLAPGRVDEIIGMVSADVAPVGHCVYAHRNPQGDVVQEYDGWMRGYE